MKAQRTRGGPPRPGDDLLTDHASLIANLNNLLAESKAAGLAEELSRSRNAGDEALANRIRDSWFRWL